MKKISILGISFLDLTEREMMRKLREYLDNGALNTAECLTIPMLTGASSYPEQKKWLEAMDVMICCDAEILKVTDASSNNRVREVESNGVLSGFFRQISHDRRLVYLLTDTAEKGEKLEKRLKTDFKSIVIAGKGMLPPEEEGNAVDELVNDINVVAPSVILSTGDAYLRERFIQNNRSRINADVWMGMDESVPLGEVDSKWKKLMKTVQRKLFLRKVDRYKNKEEQIDR